MQIFQKCKITFSISPQTIWTVDTNAALHTHCMFQHHFKAVSLLFFAAYQISCDINNRYIPDWEALFHVLKSPNTGGMHTFTCQNLSLGQQVLPYSSLKWMRSKIGSCLALNSCRVWREGVWANMSFQFEIIQDGNTHCSPWSLT